MSPVTVDQRLESLASANDRRLAVAALKREFLALDPRAGRRLAISLLQERDERIASVDVGPFLLWVRRVGRERVKRFLLIERISVWARCGDLTDRQRGVVIEFLECR